MTASLSKLTGSPQQTACYDSGLTMNGNPARQVLPPCRRLMYKMVAPSLSFSCSIIELFCLSVVLSYYLSLGAGNPLVYVVVKCRLHWIIFPVPDLHFMLDS